MMKKGIEIIKKIAIEVAEVQYNEGVEISVSDVVEGLKFGLVEVVYEWAREEREERETVRIFFLYILRFTT